MVEQVFESRDAKPAERARSTVWPAYAACIWAVLFGLASFIWAIGAMMGSELLITSVIGAGSVGQVFEDLALERDPGFIATLWATGVLKMLAGLVALALVRPWGRAVPRRFLILLSIGGGAVMFLYEGAETVQHALMAAGVIDTPERLGASAVRWHLALWDPWWLLGAVLFVVAGWIYRRETADRSS